MGRGGIYYVTLILDKKKFKCPIVCTHSRRVKWRFSTICANDSDSFTAGGAKKIATFISFVCSHNTFLYKFQIEN